MESLWNQTVKICLSEPIFMVYYNTYMSHLKEEVWGNKKDISGFFRIFFVLFVPRAYVLRQ